VSSWKKLSSSVFELWPRLASNPGLTRSNPGLTDGLTAQAGQRRLPCTFRSPSGSHADRSGSLSEPFALRPRTIRCVTESPESIRSVLDVVNARRRTSWRLVEPLAHGVNQGAYRIEDADGRQAVIKVGRNARPDGSGLSGPWGRGLLRMAPILRRARRCGWPAPAFIGFGSAGGFTYLIREWVPGRPVLVAGCTPAVLDQVLSAVATQAGLAPGGTQDWSSYVLRVLFSDDWDGLSPLRDTTPATAELLAVCRRIAATTSSRRLPRGDFVHGDFNFANILVRDDGGIAILDMEQAGRGTRALRSRHAFHRDEMAGRGARRGSA